MKNCFLLLFTLICTVVSSQDLYIKSHSTSPAVFIQNQNLQIESLTNGNYVVAGYHDSPNTIGTLFIRMFNACGTELWHKEFADTAINLDLINLNLDSTNHILVTGNKGENNRSRTPYLLKLDLSGNIIYSKLLTSIQGHNILNYSSSIAPNGDYLIYGLYRYTASPPNFAKIAITRIKPDGTLLWMKNYELSLIHI